MSLDELHVPASPDHIVQTKLVLPPQLHTQEPVPLGRGELLSVSYGHALEELGEGHVYHERVVAVSVLQVGNCAGVEQVDQ